MFWFAILSLPLYLYPAVIARCGEPFDMLRAREDKMPVSPDDVRVRKEYERTPAGIQEFLDDHLDSYIWVRGETHVITVPMYLAKCAHPNAWAEIIRAYGPKPDGVGWDIRPVTCGFTADSYHWIELYVSLPE
jgi:hypothetical protein